VITIRLEEEINSVGLDFSIFKARYDSARSITEKLALINSMGIVGDRDCVSFLLSLYKEKLGDIKELGDITTETLSELPMYDPDGGDEYVAYYDTIFHALVTAEQINEEELKELFHFFIKKEKEAVAEQDRRTKDEAVVIEEDWYMTDAEGDLNTLDEMELWDENCYRKQALLQGLSRVGTERSIPFLVERITAGDVLVYKKEVASALSKINPRESARAVLPLLKDKDLNIRKDAAKILYRLELGKIGISNEGVEYLGKLYDLGEHNNPDYFVQRLTPDGDIGVFDEKKALAGHFNLGDLSQPGGNIQTDVITFTKEVLFSPSLLARLSVEEKGRAEEVLKEFQRKYFDFYNGEFFKETGVQFNSFGFKEQGWFLHFVSTADGAQKDGAKSLVKKYGEDGFRAFLSLEYGDEAGEKILAIGERLPEVAATAIFKKYSMIIETANNAGVEVKNIFPKATREEIDLISENLNRRARNMLIGFADQLPSLSKGNQEAHKRLHGEILRKLETVRADILLFATTFKTASKEDGVSFEEIQNTNLESKPSAWLSKDEKNQMIELFKRSHSGHETALLGAELAEFEKTFEEPETKFYLLRHKGVLVGMIRFRDDGDSIYVGSFSVDDSVQSSTIGTAMLRATLDKENLRKNLAGWVDANDEKLKKLYMQEFSWQATDIFEEFGGKRYMKIIRPKILGEQPRALAA